MSIFTRYQDFPPHLKGCVATIGNFDGLHIGHRQILSKLKTLATQKGTTPVVMTFEPHTQYRFKGINAYLTPNPYKVELLNDLGIDTVLVQTFDDTFQSMTAAEFMETVLHNTLGIAGLVTGNEIRFGAGGIGTANDFTTYLSKRGITYIPVVPITHGTRKIGSSTIRSEIEAGNVHGVIPYLTRPYAIKGQVVHGEGRGQAIGFPTANIDTANFVVPKDGIYAVHVTVGDRHFKGALSIGSKPTFPKSTRTIEVHIINFNGTIYGKSITVSFIHRIRDQERFDSEQDLSNKIREDIVHVTQLLHES